MKKTCGFVIVVCMVMSAWSWPWDKNGSSGNSPRDVLKGMKEKVEEKTTLKKDAPLSPEALKAELKKRWEDSGREGYDKMPWGTTVDEFHILYPNAKYEVDGCLELFLKEGSSKNVNMLYKFYNNELISGITVYKELEGETTNEEEINLRMLELYGTPTDEKNTSEHHVKKISDAERAMANETIRMLNIPGRISANHVDYTEKLSTKTWNKSKSFRIISDFCHLIGDTETDDGLVELFVNTSLRTMRIQYENPSLESQIEETNIRLEKEKQDAKKAAEEAEKRRRMDNLDL